MNRLVRNSVVASLIASTALLSALPAANAGERWRHRHHSNGGELLAAGAIGLAAGALIAGAANAQPNVVYRPRYVEPDYYRPAPVYERPVRVYEQPRRVYYESYSSFEPWTQEWFRYCSDRYRSFNPESGTFVGYDGVERFCEAN